VSELLANPQVEAVIIATPARFHIYVLVKPHEPAGSLFRDLVVPICRSADCSVRHMQEQRWISQPIGPQWS
jgi:hypothetical protein